MSRRKQSRPRHVDNDGLGLGGEVEDTRNTEMDPQDRASEDGEDPGRMTPLKRSSDNDNEEDAERMNKIDASEEFCPSSEVPSPDARDNISACDKCGVCFTDISQFIAHKKLCGTRSRILMPYDPPVNGYPQNGYDFGRRSLDSSLGKDYSDGEDRDDRDDYESMDEEERSKNDTTDYDIGEESRKRKKADDEEDLDNEDELRYRSQIRSDENFILGLRNRMSSSLQSMRERRGEGEGNISEKSERCNDDGADDDEAEFRSKRVRSSDDAAERMSLGGSGKSDDPAIAWAMKAAERGLFGGNSNVTLEPLAATSAAVAQCVDTMPSRESVPEEVNMFRTMLFQLQQQQMMQIQMIQQMRRQLIASGVEPNMLPADMDLNMMSSEGLASVGAAMSGLQNATAAAAVARNSGVTTSSSGYNGASLSPSQAPRSRDSSRSPPRSSHKGGDRDRASPLPTSKADDRDSERHYESSARSSSRDEKVVERDITEKYLSPNKPVLDLYSKDSMASTPLTRNPLEILQEKTAASLSSLPLPLGLRPSSSSTDSKPHSSSSSLLNSSALFNSSPSLSALQKETDALKPSPILPPINIPMTPEDYKGYIQRGTTSPPNEAYVGEQVLERSQYASDDPFFKHKCRFCHKVFGSDSALQIHVRSHTGERPFKCNICGNRFSTKGNLKVHFERHKAKYPHIKMDATPVPEHLDRQPNLIPNFPPQPIPPSVPLPPPMPRLPIPSAPQGHAPSPSSSSSHIPTSSHPSPFAAGFGGSFLSSVGPGHSPFGLMPPPREGVMPFPYPLSLSLPSSMSMPIPMGRDSAAMRDSPTKLSSTGSAETSVIKSPRKESPISSSRDMSPSDGRKPSSQTPHLSPYPRHPFQYSPYQDSHHRHHSEASDGGNSEDNADREDMERKQEEMERRRPRSRHMSEDSRSDSPHSRRPSATPTTTPTASSGSPPPPLPRPSSTQSPRRSPASVISWASLTSSQAPLLPSHPPGLFPHHHHLPPGFPGLSLPLPVTPTSFPLPSPLNPVLPMSGPRVSGHSPFLPPPPPPPPQLSPPPGEGSMFRNSILPTKTIDPSENLEQYMEIQKSETSKLEALVKNIEQKITDPNQCVVCHRVLSCKSALQMHYRIHTGERPFKCKICGRSFTTKGNLKTHMGVHRAKPALRMMHQCPVCHKQFTNVLVLQQHIRAHTSSMQHMPHMPMLPSHMDWPQRPPFGLSRHHPYLPPMHHDSPSLEMPGGPPFHLGHFPRARSHSMDNERKPDMLSPKKERDEKHDEGTDKHEKNRSWDEEPSKEGESSRPHSGTSEGCDDKDEDRATSTPPRTPQDGSSASKVKFSKPGFESAFLPPAFGNTPFDAPLAALEERVKAIDSQLSQTSFEKFRNSMGLDSTYFPNSLSSASLSNGDKNSEYGSESASKPESPASGGDIPPYGFPMLGGFEGRNATTCNICLKTFACKSALDIHYRSHTKLKPFQCDVCERSFSTKGNLKQHLLTHKIRDLPDSAFDDDRNGEEGKDGDEGDGDDDDANELPNEDYPLEEDGLDEPGLDQDIDQDEDIDNMMDDFNEPPLSEEPSSPQKSQDDAQEDNNNVSNFQNHNGNEEDEEGVDETLDNESESKGSPESKHESKSDSAAERKPSPSLDSPSQSSAKVRSASSDTAKDTTNAGQRPPGSGSSSSSSNSSSHPHSSNVQHRRPNGPKHQCMTCMKPFSSASALQIHTRTHTGDKPFKCTVCSKAFTTRGNLKVHMGTHMWNNSPSRRGRRMSIEPPFLLSHMKDNPFMPAGFPPRPPPDFFYQYPMPMMNGPGSKMNEISVIQSLSGALPTLPPIPPHLMQGFLPKDEPKSGKDSLSASESGEPRDPHLEKKSLSGELDLSMKSSDRDVSPSRSPASTPSSSVSLSVHATTSGMTTTASGTPSPSNNKENSSTAALDLRHMRAAPWLWGALPCHHCGQMFPSQDSLEHHLRTQHLGKSEPASHSLSKTESHPPPPPKALLA